MNTTTTDTGPPVFDDKGRQVGGRPLDRATDAAIARYRVVEYMREKLARAEDELLDYAARVPAADRDAYVQVTDLIAEATAARITARQDRRAQQMLAALGGHAGRLQRRIEQAEAELAGELTAGRQEGAGHEH